MDEDEAALLAELRAISNQSAKSRFDDDVNNNGQEEAVPNKNDSLKGDDDKTHNISSVEEKETDIVTSLENVQDENASARQQRNEKPSGELPPWKRKRKPATTAQSPMDDVDIVVATPTKAKPPAIVEKTSTAPVEVPAPVSPDEIQTDNIGVGSGQSSNYQGERGGDAHDEELLAMLKGISSGSVDRFAEDEQDTPASAEPKLEPVKSQLPKTPASASPSRGNPRDPIKLPPWKRDKKSGVQISSGNDFDVVVAASPPKTSEISDVVVGATAENKVTGTFSLPLQEKPVERPTSVEEGKRNFKQESSFQGVRGGDAHDDELLALLKGVSAKSGAADRFSDTDDINNVPAPPSSSVPAPASLASKSVSKATPREQTQLPPWKRPKAKQVTKPPSDDIDVVVASKIVPEEAPKMEANETTQSINDTVEEPLNDAPIVGGNGDFKQHSTFQGERGGDAYDEDLLALIRGASEKSRSVDRFSGDDNGSLAQKKVTPKLHATSMKDYSELPPQKRVEAATEGPANYVVAVLKGAASPMKAFPDTQDEVASESNAITGGRGNFKQESTFQGERGGEAHDEELLALLRGISSKSGSDRIAEDHDAAAKAEPQLALMPVINKPTSLPGPTPSEEPFAPTPFPKEGQDEIVVSKDDLPRAFWDTDWKVRKEAYRVLNDMFLEYGENTSPGLLDANVVISEFEDIIPKLLAEKNAAAVEVAIQAVTSYAELCQGASSALRAEIIIKALLKGNGFASPRPSCAEHTSQLVLKLIEVGSTSESALVVVNLLVSQGLSSKKPKVVQLSASLILEAAYSFGAACLPLESVVSSLPKVLTHSNKKIRDCGMEIVAEFCRALGSKSPMEDVISKLQKSQIKDLDSLLANQSDPTPVKIGMRCQRSGSGVSSDSSQVNDNLAALQARGEALERERFEKRSAVNLMEALNQTDFSSKLKLSKWSEKVGALDIALECGGEKPYKLAQPSSYCNYVPLISDLKGLLSHTHFAVVSKSMAVLSMLADGVGEKLYPNLRPLLSKLLQLSKDKKLTKAVSSCLDSFFGTLLGYEHLLDAEHALPDATNESMEKNALARTCAIEYLERCITRGASAGPRASLTATNAKACAQFSAEKLNDSDATVRKAALKALESLQKLDDKEVRNAVACVIESLQQSNARAYKSLMKNVSSDAASMFTITAKAVSPDKRASPPKKAITSKQPDPFRNALPSDPDDKSKPCAPVVLIGGKPIHARENSQRVHSVEVNNVNVAEIPSVEEAIGHCKSLGIPLWDEPDENKGGVLVGIQSSKWQFRHAAIKELAQFVGCRPMLDSCSKIERDTVCLVVLVKEHTRGFKESNLNVVRSILELFVALCDYHEKSDCPFPKWACFDAVAVAVEKIADRKLSSLSKSLLLSICVVHPSYIVLPKVFSCAESLRAPAAHEECLIWFKTFCNEFGAASVLSVLNEIVGFLQAESGAKNVKVKRAALDLFGAFHAQLGPPFKKIVSASIKDAPLLEEVEKCFAQHPFDPKFCNVKWAKVSIFARTSKGVNGGTGGDQGMQVPKLDLISELPSDCISRMGAKEGKTAWKSRKAALEDVETALNNGTGVIDSSRLRPLVDLLRALKERLSDSQSNLKPLAARLIGRVLGSVEGEMQGKLGKIVYGSLINAAMNDNRKIMNDASMEALKIGTSNPSVLGGKLNEASLEHFVVALTSELEESEFKASGISGVFILASSFTKSLPDLDNVTSTRGETLGGRFASVLVDALSSSKVDIRAAAESLLSDCLMDRVFAMPTAKRCAGRLVPAKQRTVGTILAKISLLLGSEAEMDAPIDEPTSAHVVKTRPDSLSEHSEKRTGGPQLGFPQRVGPVATVRHQKKEEVTKHRHDNEERTSAVSNPLVYEAGPSGVQKSRAAVRSLTWPEYPEEPSGSALYSGLKKAWSPIVPLESSKKLFPDSCIRKQDDAVEGFELLRRAISLEQVGEGMAITEQLSLILRWTVFVMACKESSVGLTSLLDMLSELISYLRVQRYQFSDAETILFAPFLLEKASIAKGRFKDTYMDIIGEIKSGNIVPSKKFGPLVCVPIMENASHAKARLLACQECYHCVEAIGLSGIGKKGVLVVAKSLTDEKLPENRAAFLDLMVLLVSRMNNDVQRLSKICGSSLSIKARGLVEERMRKVEKDGGLPSPTKSKASGIPSGIPSRADSVSSRMSRLPNSDQSTPKSKLVESKSMKFETFSKGTVAADTNEMTFDDELPALDLRLGKRSPHATLTKSSSLQQPSPPSSLPKLNFSEKPGFSQTSGNSPVLGGTVSFSDSTSDPLVQNLFSTSSESNSENSTKVKSAANIYTLDGGTNEAIGAAASLRARLLKIREKNNGAASSKQNKTKSNLGDGEDHNNSIEIELQADNTLVVLNPVLDEYLTAFRKLVEQVPPLKETDSDLNKCIEILKNMHAAVSQQTNLAVNMDSANINNLREDIKDRISEVFEVLTRVIGFGFNCHPTTVNAGMSVPLLSVNLASLMAVFRSPELAILINADDLTILIKEAATALLDKRLASTSSNPSPLDEATSTQMVRAINKLAVQAATGARRDFAIQALFRLQEQLSLNATPYKDSIFNVRLSRIVTKLMSRVIKAEESIKIGDSVPPPFDSSTVDIEAIICCLDDTLMAAVRAEKDGIVEGVTAIRNSAKLVLTAMLKARGEANTLCELMANMGMDPVNSELGKLLSSCSADLGISSSTGATDSASKGPDIASLVSAVGSSNGAAERKSAVNALKEYKQLHGDTELNMHLENVSGTFRDFLLEQLSEQPRSPSPKTSSSAMTERLKLFRSKLGPKDGAIAVTTVPAINVTRMSEDTGSKSVLTESSASPVKSGANAFRDRLAAANEKRSDLSSSANNILLPSPSGDAGSRAAALRARLQAVRMQSNLPNNGN